MRSPIFWSVITLAASVHGLANGVKRHEDGDCSAEPAGVSGYTTSPDTDTAFQNNPEFASAANSAATPSSYTEVFSNLQAAVIDADYITFDYLQSYDPGYCAQRCSSSVAGCSSFNIYFERDPTIDPGVNCTNPPSLTYIKCAYYSDCVTQAEATNDGQYCQLFHTVIAGSNAYALNKCSASSSSSSTTTTTTSSTSATTQMTTSQPSTTTVVSTTTTIQSTTTSAAPSCSACAAGLTTDNNGHQYNVQCNTNFWGSDLGPVAASCYEDCFDICDDNPDCNAFSWDSTAPPISCWPKSISSSSTQQPGTEQGVVFASLIPACPACVSGKTTDGSGKAWQVTCNGNYRGDDFVQKTAYCYEDCFDLCDDTNGCTAFTFDQTTNICWLKNPAVGTIQPFTEPKNVFAEMIPTCAACQSGSYTDAQGQQWQVTCDSVLFGWDFQQTGAGCFSDCFTACDDAQGCTAFSFDETNSLCWLKNPWNGNIQSGWNGNFMSAEMDQSNENNENQWDSWNLWQSWQ